MRSSNRASLTVVVTGRDNQVQVDAIGSGGGQGALFSFSWGGRRQLCRHRGRHPARSRIPALNR